MSTAAIAWAVVAAVAAVGVPVVVRTRWLQSRTLEKCIALSVTLHAVLAIVCAFVGGWAPASWGQRDDGRMTMVVTLSEEPLDGPLVADSTEVPSDARDAALAAPPATEDAEVVESPPPLVPLSVSSVTAAAPPEDHVPLLEPPPAATESARAITGGVDIDREHAEPAAVPRRSVPAAYADRVGDRRAAAARARGGSEDTERAVQAALRWLVVAQSPDGRWNAVEHGGGMERSMQGQHRQGVGTRSDHGVTGLALLAFLGAGSTHLDGVHADSVARGLRFLIDRQRPDGSLAGEAEFFTALYCHGMATIALAEAAAITGDESLRPPLERAVAHTLAMQHPRTGGWRYAAGDRGDTSQCGWQVMVLATARSAGLGGFDAAEARARGFLQSVASGPAGGLAAYRPGERPSVAMTAEALYCRLVLGMPAGHPSATEAVAMIAGSSPAPSSANAYTWYYATLASFHAGGPQWNRWNAELQRALLPMQRRDGGPLDGSWDPDAVWGGHGGRVYATALSAMTLEVYYRHAPLHERSARMAAAP